jgi:hypothetical protein
MPHSARRDYSLEARVLRAFPSDADYGEVELRNALLDALQIARTVAAVRQGTERHPQLCMKILFESRSRFRGLLGRSPKLATRLAAYGPTQDKEA